MALILKARLPKGVVWLFLLGVSTVQSIVVPVITGLLGAAIGRVTT